MAALVDTNVLVYREDTLRIPHQAVVEFVAVVTRPLSGGSARLWKLAVAAFPPYEEYQAKTTRRIPVFVAEPRA